jgi:hypothetical protein
MIRLTASLCMHDGPVATADMSRHSGYGPNMAPDEDPPALRCSMVEGQGHRRLRDGGPCRRPLTSSNVKTTQVTSTRRS